MLMEILNQNTKETNAKPLLLHMLNVFIFCDIKTVFILNTKRLLGDDGI